MPLSKTMKASLAATLGLPLLAGACGLGPGDYVTYRVSGAVSSMSGDCDPGDDTTTIRSGSTVLIYFVEGADGAIPYLDTGSAVLEGVETDDGYTFSGQTVDVNDQGNAEITQTTKVTTDVILDGASVSGTSTTTVSTSCSGECGFFDPFTCTVKTEFVGVEVDETVTIAN